MKTHQFTLILSNVDTVTEDAANALFEAGCDDGTFCARDGVARVHFDRDAPSLEEAIQSAINDVIAAGFQVSRVESDEFATISRFNQQLSKA